MSVSSELAGKASTQSFVTALVVNSALLIVEVVGFVYLKQHFRRVYSPRSFLPPPEKRSDELPEGAWKWVLALLYSPSKDIIRKNGLDAYMHVRFIRMLIKIFGVYFIVTWSVLLAVDAAGIPGSKSAGLDQFNWQNIPPEQTKRYAAHLIIVWILTLYTLWVVRNESIRFVELRHQFLISPSHCHLSQARTVLITSVPDELANERALRKWASFVPGGVGRVWIYKDSRELNKEYDERLKECQKLEKAVSSLLRTATMTWRSQQTAEAKATANAKDKEIEAEKKAKKANKEAKKAAKTKKKQKPKDEEKQESDSDDDEVEQEPVRQPEEDWPKPPPTMEGLLELVPKATWPTHRTGFLPFTGEKVDTIDYCKTRIATMNAKIEVLQHKYHEGNSKNLGSVFIECNLQIGAHVLAQCVSYHVPLKMVDKSVDVNPKDIIWANLDDGAYETRSRFVIAWGLTIGLIMLWFLPVSFVGLLSNVTQLCSKVSWLAWICKAPTPVPGIIQGLLPPVLLAVLWMLLPFALRVISIYQCLPQYTRVDLLVYKRFFIFLVIHGFLVVTLTSGITASIAAILDRPAAAVTELASRLPLSSVFFLTYMVTQGFAGAGMALLQIAPLVLYLLKKKFLGQTPRQAFGVMFTMPSANFSLILPRMSLLATIGIAYSVISPIINGLALATFVFYYFAWKFLLTYVFDQPYEIETGGLYFPMLVSNLFAGLYIEHTCLAVLFFLKAASGGQLEFLPQGILMVVLCIITFFVNVLVNNAVKPVVSFLPMSLGTRNLQEKYERHARHRKGLAAERPEEIDESDLFNRKRLQHVMKRRVRNLRHKIGSKISETLTNKKEPEAPKQEVAQPKYEEKPANNGDIAKASGVDPAIAALALPIVNMENQAGGSAEKVEKGKDRLPMLSPAAPALKSDSDGDSQSENSDDEIEEHAFDHPATYKDQSWIWVPQDGLGFSKVLVHYLKTGQEGSVGVEASDIGAMMDYKGTVEVTRNPPDEDWEGGFDR